jgi:hypothetical protein
MKIFLLTITVLLLTIGCKKDHSPINGDITNNIDYQIYYDDSLFYDPNFKTNFKGIYTVTTENKLYYSSYDSINFNYITTFDKLICPLYISRKHKLLLVPTYTKLYFINLDSRKKIAEIEIPGGQDPGSWEESGEKKIYPCHWNDDYCIVINRSVFLLNLLTKNIEKTIWDANSAPSSAYFREYPLSENGTTLYIHLDYYGCWPISDDLSRCDRRAALAELNLISSEFILFYDYHQGTSDLMRDLIRWTVAGLFITKKYILVYNANIDRITKFDRNTKKIVGEFVIKLPNYESKPFASTIRRAFIDKDNLIVHNGYCTYFTLDPESEQLIPYFPLYYDSLYTCQHVKSEGGDFYSYIRNRKTNKIINLSRKKVVKNFEFENTLIFIVEEN